MSTGGSRDHVHAGVGKQGRVDVLGRGHVEPDGVARPDLGGLWPARRQRGARLRDHALGRVEADDVGEVVGELEGRYPGAAAQVDDGAALAARRRVVREDHLVQGLAVAPAELGVLGGVVGRVGAEHGLLSRWRCVGDGHGGDDDDDDVGRCSGLSLLIWSFTLTLIKQIYARKRLGGAGGSYNL